MFNKRNYRADYGKSHPGDSGAFAVVIVIILVLAALAYGQMQ